MSGGLLEREAELARLAKLMDGARAASGGLALIEGPPGIGKTRLLDEAASQAEAEGMLVLRSRGVALENEFAFGVVRQLFEGVLAGASSVQRQALLSGPAGLAGALLGWMGDGQPRPASDAGFASLHGLYWLCFNLAARRPLLLAIDDLHWADPASLRFFGFLSERLEGLPVLLVLALRPPERGAPNPSLGSIRNHPDAVLLKPSELSELGARHLIEAAFGGRAAPEFSSACFEVTGGNPFYLRALVDGLLADRIQPVSENTERVAIQLPETVVRALVLRLSRLQGAGVSLAKALAVLGPDVELPEAAELARTAPAAAARAADALSSAGILAARRPLRFMHPIIQAAVYAELPTSERSQMHLRAAHILADRAAPDERVASHLLAAEPSGDTWCVAVLRRAADEAIAGGAPESAVRYLERARREGQAGGLAPQLLFEQGRAERLAGDPGAVERLEQALAGLTDPGARAAAAQELAVALVFRDRFSDAVGVLERAIAELGELDIPLVQALEAQLLAAGALHLSTRPVQREHLERINASELGNSLTERMLLANVAQWKGSAGEPVVVVRDLVERALADDVLLEELTSDSQIFHCAIDALLWGDVLEPARYWFNRAMDDARSRGSLMGVLQAAALRAEVFYRLGELGEAEADARDALEGGGGDRWVLAPVAVQVLVNVLIDQGQLRQAADLLAGHEIHSGMDQPGMTNWLASAQGRLALATGDWQVALDSFTAIGQWMTAWGERRPALLDWRSGAATAAVRLGDVDSARRLSAEVIDLAREQGLVRSLGVGLCTGAAIIGGNQAVEMLREAVTVLASSSARLEHARALIDLGAALRRQNHRRESREPLREGIELALSCGASAVCDRGQSELIAAGARPRRHALSGLESLTPSERRVAQLATAGLSTPEIAQQLFVTVNTIETHLRHVYAKLGVHSRSELAGALNSRAAEEVTPAGAPASHDQAPPPAPAAHR